MENMKKLHEDMLRKDKDKRQAERDDERHFDKIMLKVGLKDAEMADRKRYNDFKSRQSKFAYRQDRAEKAALPDAREVEKKRLELAI